MASCWPMSENRASIVTTVRSGGQCIDVSGGAGELMEDLPPRSNRRKPELIQAAQSLGWRLLDELPGAVPEDEILWFELAI
jgi:hypothetical protein